jgi:hypothetical protein
LVALVQMVRRGLVTLIWTKKSWNGNFLSRFRFSPPLGTNWRSGILELARRRWRRSGSLVLGCRKMSLLRTSLVGRCSSTKAVAMTSTVAIPIPTAVPLVIPSSMRGPVSLLAVVMIVPHWRMTNPTTRMESKKRAKQRTQPDVLADEEVPGRRRSEKCCRRC